MEVQRLQISDLALVVPDRHMDERGFFSETFNRQALSAHGIAMEFVQDNHARSSQSGVVRGLHFQAPPHAQDKLIRVSKGAIFDVALDIRQSSPTYGKHVGVILSAENWHQLLVPKGFAHGYCTLERDTEVIYKVSDYYAPECERGIAWDDPALGIDWPVVPEAAVVSEKDRGWPAFGDLDDYFDTRR